MAIGLYARRSRQNNAVERPGPAHVGPTLATTADTYGHLLPTESDGVP
jgi:hypothetical protein